MANGPDPKVIADDIRRDLHNAGEDELLGVFQRIVSFIEHTAREKKIHIEFLKAHGVQKREFDAFLDRTNPDSVPSGIPDEVKALAEEFIAGLRDANLRSTFEKFKVVQGAAGKLAKKVQAHIAFLKQKGVSRDEFEAFKDGFTG